jgi:hypothetical protein
MEEKIAEEIGKIVGQQYGLLAVMLVGMGSLLVTVLRESAKLRKEVAYQVGRDLLGKRFDAYGALWVCMEPVAIYGEGSFGPTDLRALRQSLAHWYFSAQGGLFLTKRARDFYFALQGLLAEMSRPSNWHCESRPDRPKEIFLKLAAEATKRDEKAPAKETFVPDLENAERLSPVEWQNLCESISAHLTRLVEANSSVAGESIFACVQQISSVLRSNLAHDVRSRLDVDLPSV